MKIAVCDDMATDRNLIQSWLAGTVHEVFPYERMEALLAAMAKGAKFDLLFLDVEIPGGISGVEAARQVRLADKDVMIVFVTSYDSQVWNALPMDIMHFLVKPIDNQQFRETLARCEEKYERNNYLVFGKNAYAFAKSSEEIALRVNDIYYIAVQGNYSQIYHRLSPEPFQLRASITKIDKYLRKFGVFYRCHQSYIINWRHVFKLFREQDNHCWATIADGDWRKDIPLSRDKWQDATSLFHDFRRGY